MPYRKNAFAAGEHYHVFNRGVNKGLIFFNPENYLYLIRLMKRNLEKNFVTLLAYCLMPNHYHLLLRQDGDVPLSRFVNVVFNAYVQAVNRQQGRIGSLFGSRFRHSLIDREEYLIHLCRYIHLNPVKAGLASKPDDWPYSNYLEWTSEIVGASPNSVLFREHFSNPDDYRKFVMEGLDQSFEQKEIQNYIWD